MVEKLVNFWSKLARDAYSCSVVASILCGISFGETAAWASITEEFENFWLLLQDREKASKQSANTKGTVEN